jgi:hypothetical protein
MLSLYPDASGIWVESQTYRFADSADPTKKMIFDLTAISAATTRTMSWPNTSDTVVVEDFAQTLTNKTVTANTNNVLSRGLWYGSGAASISNYAAPTPVAGQVLTAIDAVTSESPRVWPRLEASRP